MSSDTLLSSRTQRILNTFRESHADTHADKYETYRKQCPFCQIIVEEQITHVYGILEATVRPVLLAAWTHWDVNGYPIANGGASFDEFLGDITHRAFLSWVQPIYRDDVELTDEELMDLPIVKQKIRDSV